MTDFQQDGTIKAIETRYKGYRFRSRLEARWAVFFDALGLKWYYEPEGFICADGTHYLPDFFLHDLDAYVDVKPLPDDFCGMPFMGAGTKEASFAETWRTHRFYVIFGTPGAADPYDRSSSYAACVYGDSPYFFCECPSCGSIGIQFDGRSGRNEHKDGCSATGKGYNINSARILAAAEAARSARFEHGEQP